ncbi:hypothetical protein B0T20DRAFT_396870 [Sordaria brevicollis]|uniref:TM2 domain-containing protein n=1 Tax=Sordaria brevicollis TaxID=83679 RepID=A0AAE0P136_SORBR|nr:hypothetical protein B0T20DRAFT_396870 [Sordaria brevicollis]
MADEGDMDPVSVSASDQLTLRNLPDMIQTPCDNECGQSATAFLGYVQGATDLLKGINQTNNEYDDNMDNSPTSNVPLFALYNFVSSCTPPEITIDYWTVTEGQIVDWFLREGDDDSLMSLIDHTRNESFFEFCKSLTWRGNPDVSGIGVSDTIYFLDHFEKGDYEQLKPGNGTSEHPIACNPSEEPTQSMKISDLRKAFDDCLELFCAVHSIAVLLCLWPWFPGRTKYPVLTFSGLVVLLLLVTGVSITFFSETKSPENKTTFESLAICHSTYSLEFRLRKTDLDITKISRGALSLYLAVTGVLGPKALWTIICQDEWRFGQVVAVVAWIPLLGQFSAIVVRKLFANQYLTDHARKWFEPVPEHQRRTPWIIANVLRNTKPRAEETLCHQVLPLLIPSHDNNFPFPLGRLFISVLSPSSGQLSRFLIESGHTENTQLHTPFLAVNFAIQRAFLIPFTASLSLRSAKMDNSPLLLPQTPRPSFFRTRLGEFVVLFFILYYTLAAITIIFLVHDHPPSEEAFGAFHLQTRNDTSASPCPCLSDHCLQQQRTGTLLALFAGFVAADQWFAHNWVLAVLKMQGIIFIGLVCLWLWLHGRYFQVWQVTLQEWLVRGLVVLALWWAMDLTFWVVGGIYATPGCPTPEASGHDQLRLPPWPGRPGLNDKGNGSNNIDFILANFPFPPPKTSSYPFHSVKLHDHSSSLAKRWGHFDRLPTTEKCYRQERTATLIALFGGGILGADQLYAGNLRFGLTRLLLQVLCLVLIITVCCSSIFTESETRATVLTSLVIILVVMIQLGVWIWATVDLARWIIGGYYGTKGCPI